MDTKELQVEKERRKADKLFNFRPVFFFAVFLCLGITFAYLHLLLKASALWLLLWLPVIGIPLCFCRSARQIYTTLLAMGMLVVSFAIGVVGFGVQIDNFQSVTPYEGKTYVVGTAVSTSENGQICVGVFDEIYIDGKETDGRLIAYMPASYFEKIAVADRVLMYGTIGTDTDCFGTFGFRASEIDEGLHYVMSVDEDISIVGETSNIFLLAQQVMKETAYASMDKTSAAVTIAILTGDRTGIEKGLYDNIKLGGIAHIFAVSGLHVGSMFGFCLLILERKRRKKIPKIIRFFTTAILLTFYAGICGFSPSVMRATVICLIGYAARLTRLTTDFLQSIGAAAIVVLCISPVTLMEVGFQLSFLACLGLALLTRPLRLLMERLCCAIRNLFPKRLTRAQLIAMKNDDTLPPSVGERIRRKIISFLAASLAAQIFTSPVLLDTYGYLSGWSLLLNCIFVPLISAGFSALLLLVFLVCLLPQGAATFLMYIPNVIMHLLLLVFEVADFSTFALTGIKLSGGAYVSYYGGCICMSDKLNLSKLQKRIGISLCFLVFGITVVALNV